MSLFKNRTFILIVGLIVIALIVVFLGPYSGYITWLESPRNMLYVLALPVGLVVIWEAFKRLKANQANNQLANAVVSQAKTDQRPSGDVVQLRENFEDAVATLKQQKKRGGLGLYELPWYVIIGAPGSGKTTALKYSGLKFPLEQRSGRGALRGVGGTRNCDWWFTEEAVLLDTAGRYTTQDSDASADSAAWAEFLALLKKYRKRRPLNGVLLAISAQDLITQGQAGREAHVAAARRRLNELNKELKIQLPVYVLVTKCDLIAGFSEYFDDMSAEQRAQVLGVTFAQDVTRSGAAPNAFPAEFDAVVQGLNERVYSRLEDERDSRRRAKVFGFPQQMASLRENLAGFVADVFESTRFDQRVLLRGVYFTSGTQEGTPIDRLLGSLSRRFAVPAEAVTPSGRGKAFFIERLMKEVVLAEAGLAGVSRRLELQMAAAQAALYLSVLGAGVFLILMLAYSYRTNRAFLADYSDLVAEVRADLPPPGESAVTARPRLDLIRSLVEVPAAHREATWWSSRGWGLDQSASVEDAAANAYKDELSQALVGTVRSRIEQRLESLLAGGTPLDLYETLRAYLMLRETDADYFNKEEVRDVARREWERLYAGSEDDIRDLDGHFNWLLDAGLPSSPVNDELVRQARARIPDDAAPKLILARMIRIYDEQNQAAGPVVPPGLFVTRTNRPLGEGFPKLFTRSGFQDAESLITSTEKQFRGEEWVWAERRIPSTQRLRNDVSELYEDEYIRRWNELLQGISFPASQSQSALVEMIRRFTADRAGLKVFLQTVDRNTYLVALPDDTESASLVDRLQASGRALDLKLRGRDRERGARITKEFLGLHVFLTPADKAPIDDVLARMKDVGTKLDAMDPSKVGGSLSGSGAAGLAQAAVDLKQSASNLPGSASAISALVEQVSRQAEAASGGQIAGDVRTKYQNVVARCSDIKDRYPFSAQATSDVGLQDFITLFGPNGEFARFVREGLADYAERRGGLYVAKQLPSGRRIENIESILRSVNDAERIREAFFPSGEPRFRFDISVRDLHEQVLLFELGDGLFVDGKPLRFEGQSMPTREAAWPTKSGELKAWFTTDRSRGPQMIGGGDGPWTFFKLVDRYGTLTRVNETTFDLRLSGGGYSVDLRLITFSSNSPLALMQTGFLRNFRCDR